MYLCAQNHDLKRGGTFETAKAGTFHSVTAGTSIPLFTDRVIADLYHQDIPRERKQALIDKLLITRNKLVKTIERIEELLR